MSHSTEHSRSKQGSSRRRRSRGGKSRSQGQGYDGNRGHSNRSEEFRPKQVPRYQRETPAPKLTFWQKILKAIGLYKEPAAPSRPASRHPQSEKKPVAKSNVRNARFDEKKSGERETQRGGSSQRAPRERPRGGDGSTVESNRVYVGNLSYDVTEQDLQELFKGIGAVRGVEIVYNRSTHRSKGYGFVEMVRREEAVNAVEVLHDQFFMGRKMIVSGAKSKGHDDRDDKEPVAAEKTISLAPLPEENAAAAVVEETISLAPSEDASRPA